MPGRALLFVRSCLLGRGIDAGHRQSVARLRIRGRANQASSIVMPKVNLPGCFPPSASARDGKAPKAKGLRP
jgi:hypothetical protein